MIINNVGIKKKTHITYIKAYRLFVAARFPKAFARLIGTILKNFIG